MQNFIKTILSAFQAWTKKEIIKKTGEIKEDIDNMQKEMVATNEVLDNKMNAANPVATGSFSMGRQEGSNIGRGSYAVGLDTIASGRFSHAEGYNTIASQEYAHAEGAWTSALASSSHAEGNDTIADGGYSHAEGCSTIASNISSHAEGIDTVAMGAYSHAEGKGTAAAGECSHAEGKQTYIDLYLTGQGGSKTYTVAGSPSLVVGALLVSEKYPSAMAYITAISGKTITTNKTLSASAFSSQRVKMFPKFASGIASHIEGQDTTASGNYSHAEGKSTTASGESSHAEGYQTTASGTQSHAEGNSTTASGNYSHAEGYFTTASGDYSHAEGSGTKASGTSSHVEGKFNKLKKYYLSLTDEKEIRLAPMTKYQYSSKYTFNADTGIFSLVNPTISTPSLIFEFPIYLKDNNTWYKIIDNCEDGEVSTFTAIEINIFYTEYAHIVGNGTSDTERSNAHTLDWHGVGWFQGGLQVGGTEQDGEGVGYVPAISSAQVGQTIVVSEVDENGKPTKWEAADAPQGGGATEMTLLAEIDCSVANGNIELTNLGGITEVYVEWGNIKNGSTTDSGYTLYVNGTDCGMAVIPIFKDGTSKYGWSQAIYNGIAWICSRSDGASSTSYQRFGSALLVQYNHAIGVGMAETITFAAPLTQYQATSGTIKIWGR